MFRVNDIEGLAEPVLITDCSLRTYIGKSLISFVLSIQNVFGETVRKKILRGELLAFVFVVGIDTN